MWRNTQIRKYAFPVDFVTFTKEILIAKLNFLYCVRRTGDPVKHV